MNIKNNPIFKLTYLSFALLLIMYSCKGSKEFIQISLIEKSKNERLDILISQALQYETFSSSLKFTIKPGEKSKSISTNGQLRMIKDQLIQFSLRDPILGIIEAFRITLTPDEIIIVDRVNKRYLVESMKEIQKETRFDFNFYSFQALLSNQLFIAGKEKVTPNDYVSYKIREDQFFSYIENIDSHNIEYAFQSDYTNRILKTQMYKKEWESGIQWDYAGFGLTDNKKLFPMEMKMKMNLPDDTVLMNLSFSNVAIDKVVDIEKNYPVKYHKISWQEMMKQIKNMQ